VARWTDVEYSSRSTVYPPLLTSLVLLIDIVLYGPYTRKIRILSIGAGVTGIMNAYHIQKFCENVEHVVYEKDEDIGGTWLENRYPGMFGLW